MNKGWKIEQNNSIETKIDANINKISQYIRWNWYLMHKNYPCIHREEWFISREGAAWCIIGITPRIFYRYRKENKDLEIIVTNTDIEETSNVPDCNVWDTNFYYDWKKIECEQTKWISWNKKEKEIINDKSQILDRTNKLLETIKEYSREKAEIADALG